MEVLTLKRHNSWQGTRNYKKIFYRDERVNKYNKNTMNAQRQTDTHASRHVVCDVHLMSSYEYFSKGEIHDPVM
jgi:hypothetical protein